jgi:hypothetical protein
VSLRRECLDFLIPFNERHLKFVLTSWIAAASIAMRVIVEP